MTIFKNVSFPSNYNIEPKEGNTKGVNRFYFCPLKRGIKFVYLSMGPSTTYLNGGNTH
jgi:hypothetical protein